MPEVMRLLEVLRSDTREQHEALHTHPLLTGLSDSSLTLSDFHHILLAFEAYYSHAEAACQTGFPEDVPNAPVLNWLDSDLAQQAVKSWANRLTFKHAPIDTPSKLAGYLYTKQGSTLGGHVISKHLERQLGLIPRIDQWFFAGYGPHNGAQWKLFVDILERHNEAFCYDEVVLSARQSFESITWFCDAVATLKKMPIEVAHEA